MKVTISNRFAVIMKWKELYVSLQILMNVLRELLFVLMRTVTAQTLLEVISVTVTWDLRVMEHPA